MSLRKYRWKKPDWRERKKKRQKKWKRKHEPAITAAEAPISSGKVSTLGQAA
ncbi:MAG: hypothetical protein QW835_05235 [Candidatus Hadarchaeum sp.]|uniref:hypothetical protein n=1 Tax=Candidatus Hadarchaeum sp. TaxID=2883567 RepID=UPI00317FE51B